MKVFVHLQGLFCCMRKQSYSGNNDQRSLEPNYSGGQIYDNTPKKIIANTSKTF